MTRRGSVRAGAAAILLIAMPGAAAAKKERAEIVLPIVVEAPTEPPTRVYSFRKQEFFGGQPARYRSAVALEAAVPLHELGSGAAIPAGKPLFEMEAKSRNFAGSFYCTARPPSKKLLGILCLADRDRDGRMDELWTAIGSLPTLVPLPHAHLERTINPVKFLPVEDRSKLALQLGFHVSGVNPIVGAHHFYAMLSVGGELGYTFMQAKNSVTVGNLPNTFSVGGAQIRLEGFENKVYRARVTRPFPEGERMVGSAYPTQTIFITIPR